MKSLLIFLSAFTSASAFASATQPPVDSFALQGRDFEWQHTDSCVSRDSRGVKKCRDTTISFEQPDAADPIGWEQKCGPTAAANILAMRCLGKALTVAEADAFGYDNTPGWRPDTIISALNSAYYYHRASRGRATVCPKGAWKQVYSFSKADFIADIKKSIGFVPGTGGITRVRTDGSTIQMSPIPVFTQAGVLGMHWVTLVDMTDNATDRFGCNAIINTWGAQKTMTCEQLVDYGNTYLGFMHGRFEKR